MEKQSVSSATEELQSREHSLSSSSHAAVAHSTEGDQLLPFGARLLAATERYGRLCVGIDPHPSLLESWGLSYTVEGLRRFSDICLEAFAGEVALVKPQVAFFEAFGSAGFAVFEDILRSLKETQTLSLADIKRGDIGSTMAAYAQAWLSSESPLAADAITLSPFLGVGSLEPAFDLAEKTGRGIFVLAQTSNPEGKDIQMARTLCSSYSPLKEGNISGSLTAENNEESHLSQGAFKNKSVTIDDSRIIAETEKTVAQSVIDNVGQRNAQLYERYGSGSFGVVIGATIKNTPELDLLRGPILLPGVGAQGGSAQDVARVVGKYSRLAVPSVSRAVLSQGPHVQALRNEVRRISEQYPA